MQECNWIQRINACVYLFDEHNNVCTLNFNITITLVTLVMIIQNEMF